MIGSLLKFTLSQLLRSEGGSLPSILSLTTLSPMMVGIVRILVELFRIIRERMIARP